MSLKPMPPSALVLRGSASAPVATACGHAYLPSRAPHPGGTVEKLPLRFIPPKQSLGPSRSHGHGRPWFFHSCPFPATPGSSSVMHRLLPERKGSGRSPGKQRHQSRRGRRMSLMISVPPIFPLIRSKQKPRRRPGRVFVFCDAWLDRASFFCITGCKRPRSRELRQ